MINGQRDSGRRLRTTARDALRDGSAPAWQNFWIDRATLVEWSLDARDRTLALIADVSDPTRACALRENVNPLLWEMAHVAWFQERWILREVAGNDPLFAQVDALYNSAVLPHDERWTTSMLGFDDTIRYLRESNQRCVDYLDRAELSSRDRYLALLSIYHEDMHAEAFIMTRQHFGHPRPDFCQRPRDITKRRKLDASTGTSRSITIAAGSYELGADPRGSRFAFDNEMWQHRVSVDAFSIDRHPITVASFLEFVEDGGYAREELWDDAGWRWRVDGGSSMPCYWRRSDDGWQRRDFDAWIELDPTHPMLHVSGDEADAYCRWAGRRLPTELEWEVAALAELDPTTHTYHKRQQPWIPTDDDSAEDTPIPAQLDATGGGCVGVDAFPDSASAFGVTQMVGNVWEWTSSDFAPYPGFEAGDYREYSAPWFHDHKVLRGGSWATRGRLARADYRNFYKPHRNDVFAGFRTCAKS